MRVRIKPITTLIKGLITALCGLFLYAGGSAQAQEEKKDSSRGSLSVLIVVDQLSAWGLEKNQAKLSGGIKQMLEKGTVFWRGDFDYAGTETAPGHATLATGTWPSVHGIIANQWMDDRGQIITAAEDDMGKVRPIRMRAPAFTDALKENCPDARIFSLALKNRGAVFLAGRTPNWSFYYNPKLGQLETALAQEDQLKKTWMRDLWKKHGLEAAFLDTKIVSFGSELSAAALSHEKKMLLYPLTEHSVDLLTDTAVSLVDQFQLGQTKSPDVLTISYATLDYVGHTFGVPSVQHEMALKHIDRSIGVLLEHLKKILRVRVLLTSDHGVTCTPEYVQKQGVAGYRVEPMRVAEKLETKLSDASKSLGAKIVIDSPFVYFPEKLPNKELEDVRSELLRVKGIRYAELTGRLVENSSRIPEPYRSRLVRNLAPDIHPILVFVPEEHSIVMPAPGPEEPFGTSHGTPYAPDREVPILIFGTGVKKASSNKNVPIIQVAPTMAAWLSVPPPSSAKARPLPNFDKPLADLVSER